MESSSFLPIVNTELSFRSRYLSRILGIRNLPRQGWRKHDTGAELRTFGVQGAHFKNLSCSRTVGLAGDRIVWLGIEDFACGCIKATSARRPEGEASSCWDCTQSCLCASPSTQISRRTAHRTDCSLLFSAVYIAALDSWIVSAVKG